MFLPLKHTTLDIYNVSGELIIECYKIVAVLPSEEKYNLTDQIKRAALSVKLNISEGASRKSLQERKLFYEIARSSVVELDTAFDVCVKLKFIKEEELEIISKLINRCYAMLSKMTE